MAEERYLALVAVVPVEVLRVMVQAERHQAPQVLMEQPLVLVTQDQHPGLQCRVRAQAWEGMVGVYCLVRVALVVTHMEASTASEVAPEAAAQLGTLLLVPTPTEVVLVDQPTMQGLAGLVKAEAEAEGGVPLEEQGIYTVAGLVALPSIRMDIA